MAAEKKPSFGPYELAPGVNALHFGSDPHVTLEQGKSFMTSDAGVAAFLDEHPQVRHRKKTASSSSKSSSKAAANAAATAPPDSGGID
jgi:hypothetical protein